MEGEETAMRRFGVLVAGGHMGGGFGGGSKDSKHAKWPERGSVEKSPRLETQMQIRRAELAFGEKPSRMRETLC
jgi:hypothetical protein